MISDRIQFRPEFPLADLKPADYNPRRISPEAFAKLQASLRTYGVCKPVILNGDGTLVAGHQRTKAMTAIGMTHTPAILMGAKVARQDEIRFNLFHNSIETADSPARITTPLAPGYSEVPFTAIEGSAVNGSVIKESAQLLSKYGPWGSVVATPDGTVVVNSDYALACKATRLPVLVYTMPDGQVPGFLDALAEDYGEYHFEPLGVKAYNQLQCQLNRLRGRRGEDGELVAHSNDQQSRLYVEHVIPFLDGRDDKPRLVDFGAGHGDYARRLRAAGHTALAYEPHLQPSGSRAIDVRGVVLALTKLGSEVRARGLFDVTVLDSVLNSVTSLDFEDKVLTSCNALTAKDGTFFTCARNKEAILRRARMKFDRSTQRALNFLDANDFSASYRDGMWTMQHFHTMAGLKALLERYFEEVTIYGTPAKTMIQAKCVGPKPLGLDRYRAALDVELNMELPGGIRHNRHGATMDAILEAVVHRDSAPA